MSLEMFSALHFCKSLWRIVINVSLNVLALFTRKAILVWGYLLVAFWLLTYYLCILKVSRFSISSLGRFSSLCLSRNLLISTKFSNLLAYIVVYSIFLIIHFYFFKLSSNDPHLFLCLVINIFYFVCIVNLAWDPILLSSLLFFCSLFY